MVISHNLWVMSARRQYNIVDKKKEKLSEKLSSGYRINKAADDAAELSISEKLREQIRGLNQGAKNAENGISLIQVADGALAEVHDMLHRITELAVQAANDTNTIGDRKAIQSEIYEIYNEINRISYTTEFNTKKLFDSTFEVKNYEIMPNPISDVDALKQLRTANFRIADVDITYKGITYSKESINAYLAAQSVNIIYWDMLDENLQYDGPGGKDTNALLEGLRLIAKNDTLITEGYKEAGLIDSTQYANRIRCATNILNNVETIKIATPSYAYSLLSYAHAGSSDTYYGFNKPVMSGCIGRDIQYQVQEYARGHKISPLGSYNMYSGIFTNMQQQFNLSSDFAFVSFGYDKDGVIASFRAIQKLLGYNQDRSIVSGRSPNYLWIQSGGNVGDGLFLSVDRMNTTILGIDGLDVTSYEGACSAIEKADKAVEILSKQRNKLGAQQNRIEHMYDNILNVKENTQAAESKSRDTSMTKEMLEYLLADIVVQAGQAILAQSNQAKESILLLLQ